MRKISNNHYAYASLSPLELNEMTGGFMMGLIMKFSVPALQHDGRQEAETMRTGARYADADNNIAPRRGS